jgi:glycosyltransferase 2 family protein
VNASTRSGASRWATSIGIGLSAVSLYFALRGTDLRQIGSALSGAHLRLIAPLVIAQVLYFALKAVRWRLLLQPIRSTPTAPLVGPMMIGFMGNNLLPAHLGELIRTYLGTRVLNLGASQVLATLVLERIFDFAAVLVLFAWGAVALENVPRPLVSAGYVSAAISALGIAAAATFAVWTRQILRVAEAVSRPVPDKLRRAILRQLDLAASGMEALRQPSLLSGIVITSVLQWLLMAASIYISFRAVDISVPFTASFIVLGATVLGVIVPAAPGFFGTLELTFVLALAPFSVGDNRAMASAVFYHVIPYVGVTLAGLYFLRQMGVRLQDVERQALDSEQVRVGGPQ